jgi:hypothetical protein
LSRHCVNLAQSVSEMKSNTFIIKVPVSDEELKAPKAVDRWTNRMNNELNSNLDCLDPNDVKTIVSNLKTTDPTTQGQHIFFEAVLGGYFARSGYGPRYEQTIDGFTPDWSLTEEPYRGIVEVVNIDPSAAVKEKLSGDQIFFVGDRADRLYDAIRTKVSKYRALIQRKRTPFVIAVHPSFASCLRLEDIHDALSNEEYGIFLNSPELSGVLSFESRTPPGKSSYYEHWHYPYWTNLRAANPWHHLP